MYQIFETIVFLITVGIVVLVVAKLFMRDLRRKYDINIGRRMFITSLIVAFLMLLLISSIFLSSKYRYSHEYYRDISSGVFLSEIFLTIPTRRTRFSVEEALLNRKSIREWRKDPVHIDDLSMILWAAYGVVENIYGWYRRTSPSAGATYPMEIYVVVGERSVATSQGFLEPGSYKYDPIRHSIKLIKKGDLRNDLYIASLDQEWVRDAPVSIVICAVHRRTTRVYGERGFRYVYMEAGHVGQNIYLMATALGLGTVAVGAFYDDVVAKIIGASSDEEPLYIFPIGVPNIRFVNSFEYIERFYGEMRGG